MATDNRIMRVHYYERQFLRAQDFNDEQAYHIAMRRRHNIAHHTWGIVRGLELEFNAAENLFVVKPGFAVDGYGRELILTDAKPIAISEFDSRASDQIDVWLEYRLEPAGQGNTNGVCPVDEEAAAFNRWLEQPEIVLKTETIYDQDRRSPRGVPTGENFNATLTPPDSPERYFPIYLGQMRRTTTGRRTAYVVTLTGRPYAGVVGREISHPSGKTRVVLGENGEACFAVNIHADKSDSKPTLTIDPPETAGQPDKIAFNGNVTVRGDATISGALQFNIPKPNTDSAAAESTKSREAAEKPRPGVMYLHKPQKQSEVRELRVELATNPNPDTPNSFAVGVWSDQDKKFKPIFRVDANGVTVSGTLVAQEVIRLPEQFRTSEEALAMIRSRRLTERGVSNTGLNDLLEKLLKGLFSGRGDADSVIPHQ